MFFGSLSKSKLEKKANQKIDNPYLRTAAFQTIDSKDLDENNENDI